ncbi:MAG: T9SS type A sorting domain-containing protein [Ginsengibacter sp.]
MPIIISVLLLSHSNAFSQHEYLATVDPSTGIYTKLDSIPGVRYILLFDLTAVDQINNRVTFVGGPSQTQFSLCTVNALDGKILYKVALPNYGDLISLDYSSTSGLLYGLIVQSGVYSLATINVQTGNYAVIDTLNVDGVNEMVVDDLHKVIYMKGTLNGNLQTFTVNTLTGEVVKSVAANTFNLVYDNSRGKLYGISPDLLFGSLDPSTGIFTPINALTSDVIGITQGNATFDEKDQVYIFTASDNQGESFLYSINAITGAVVHKAAVSLANDISIENLIQYRFDNSSQILYALHWEPKMNPMDQDSSCNLNMKIHLYPNPFSDHLIINKDPTKCKVNLNLYNALGQLLMTGLVINDGRNDINLSYLPQGVYFYDFYSSGKRLLTGRIVKIK